MPSLGIKLYFQILCVVFALFSPYPNGFVKAQQSLSCAAGYILVNSVCVPTAVGQITNGCTTNCISICPTQTTNIYCVPVSPCANQLIAPIPCTNQPITPCPNQPVAPLPNQPGPNQPVAPIPCPNQPVAPLPYQPCPNQPVAPTPCPNQPIAPCPNQPVAPLPYQPGPVQPIIPTPCPNQTIIPCPNQPVAPLPYQPCPNQPVAPTPCPNQPIAPCPNQPVAPLPYQPGPVQPIIPTPCPNQTIIPCPNQPVAPLPYQPCPNQPVAPIGPNAPPTRSPTTLPPVTLPPAPLRCPEGTIPLNNYCRLVYCNKGVYRNNKCVQTVCPEGTTWTGYRCTPVQPIVHSIAFNNEIVTHFNRTEPDIIVHNVNNMVVNASVVIPLVPAPSPELPTTTCGDNQDAEDCVRQNCCIVISPRLCKRSSYRPSKWNCYSHRYQRCGDFCVAPIVYLKAPSARETSSYVVVPPNENLVNCRQAGSCPESEDYYDCSGCAMGIATSCSSYCYNYQCSARKCNFYDQREYCNQYPGGNGCQEQDGWFDGDGDGDDYNNVY